MNDLWKSEHTFDDISLNREHDATVSTKASRWYFFSIVFVR